MIIATLIAAGRLSRDRICGATAALADAGLEPGEWRWIDECSAADLDLRGDLRLARSVAVPGLDIIVQPSGPREKRLLVADMDSTMIGQECIDELADYAGVRDRVARITERAMHGELDFAAALRERVSLLDGLSRDILDLCRAERVRPNPGAVTLVRTMRARGAATLLVSGGFTAFAEPVAEEIGFEHVRANRLGEQRAVLTGSIEGEIVDAAAKRTALVELRDRLGIAPAEVLAVGDGANDLPMIAEAGLGVAYRAKPVLAAAADARLDHNPLDALLWVQGIPRAEWVSA